MNRLATLLLAAALPLAASAAGSGRVKVAVMDVKNVQGVQEGTAVILTDIVVSEVAKANVDVVSKGDISAMIGFEKEKQILGCSDDSRCLAEVGGALGVDYMLTGQVGLIGSRFRISLLLVDSKKAKVAARSARFCDHNEDALARAAQETVAELMAAIPHREGARAAAPVAAARPAAVPAPVAATTPAAAPPVSQAVATTRPNRTAAWITLGASGACLAGGVLFGVMAKSKYDDLKAQQGSVNYLTTWDKESKTITRYKNVSNGLYVVGLVGAGVGTYLYLSAKPSAVAVAPIITGEQLGLAAAGRF